MRIQRAQRSLAQKKIDDAGVQASEILVVKRDELYGSRDSDMFPRYRAGNHIEMPGAHLCPDTQSFLVQKNFLILEYPIQYQKVQPVEFHASREFMLELKRVPVLHLLDFVFKPVVRFLVGVI